VAEWLKAHAWKACLGETLTWVRIPPSPPLHFGLLTKYFLSRRAGGQSLQNRCNTQMSLNVYRRHGEGCKAERARGSAIGEFEKRRKGCKRCDFSIFVSGTLKPSRFSERLDFGMWSQTSSIHNQKTNYQPGFCFSSGPTRSCSDNRFSLLSRIASGGFSEAIRCRFGAQSNVRDFSSLP
jgi:hypothetical protein